MFQRILVPTDFSATASTAFDYALHTAHFIDAKQLDLVHVFTPQTAPNAVVIPPVEELMADRREALQSFLDKHETPRDLTIRTEMQLGFAAEEIVEMSSEYDLIIMGVTGESGMLENVFGSVSSTVAQKAHCPVLLVPAQARFREYRHILYASNDLSMSREAVLRLINFNDLYRARIHFVHINENDGESFRGEREKLFATLFSGPDPEFAFEITELQSDSVESGLQEYIQNHPIDMAIMVTRHRGFWSSFFHRSETKRMALHPEVPIMVFHMPED